MSLLREKIGLFVLLSVTTTLLYFGTQRSVLFGATIMPVTPLDRGIPFVTAFIVPYISFFFLILTPLFVIDDAQELRDVAFGFGLIVLVSSVAFLFWPTILSPAASRRMELLALDTERNACPSLHASLALYCALCAQRQIQARFAKCGLWAWTVVVIASAMLIKRHVALDIAAGAAIGWAVYTVLFRPVRVETSDSQPVLQTLRIRNQLVQEMPDFGVMTRQDGRERAREFGVFVTLATLGFCLSISARSLGSTPMLVGGILLTAVALNSFLLLMHEGMHGMLFADRRWNWVVSVLLGSTFLLSFTSYRVLHVRHHQYLGDHRDPDDYRNYSRSQPLVWFLHFVRLTFGPVLYLFLIPPLALKYGSSMQRKLICIEYTILFLIYSAMLRNFPVRELLFVWFIPLPLMGMLTAIRGFSQHGITVASDPYLASRTMLANPLIAFFLLNENYHLEHHLFPEIPSYHLPRLHHSIWPKLPRAVSGRGYFSFLAAFLRAAPRMDETPIGLVNPSEHPQ
jgi:fatty acid desaturase/membrane-associated phospholipid phosphatase